MNARVILATLVGAVTVLVATANDAHAAPSMKQGVGKSMARSGDSIRAMQMLVGHMDVEGD